MWITLETGADANAVQRELAGIGLWTVPMIQDDGQVTGFQVEPHSQSVDPARVRIISGVDEVLVDKRVTPKLDSKAWQPVTGGYVPIGSSQNPVLMAGPCSVESPAQIRQAAQMVAGAGGTFLRGGAFKPRTSPYSFSGHGLVALQWLREAADAYDLQIVSEAVSEAHAEAVAACADMIQVGSRNMQNFALLHAVGRMGKPVLLKRGMAARLNEWFAAAEHLLCAGASDVVFCERGIVGFDATTRNLLDLATVAQIKHAFGLPVIVDPSHAVGRRDLIPHMARAALAAGADGLLIEAHPQSSQACSDAPQALNREELQALGISIGLRSQRLEAIG
ncbi:MAG: 3-deoxy-7-phosphoheptulonate synthase [Myxococcota bacterium]